MATCKLSLSHTHTALTHKQTDASVCHPSLSAWTTPKRRGLAKCCPGTEKIYIFQLVADLICLCLIYSLILSSSFYPQFLFLLSNFSSSFFPSLLLQYHLTIFSSISFFLSLSLCVYTSPNIVQTRSLSESVSWCSVSVRNWEFNWRKSGFWVFSQIFNYGSKLQLCHCGDTAQR